MKKLILFGATGSVGSSVLDVARKYPDDFNVVGVSAYRNLAKLSSIIEEFSPKYVSIIEKNNEFINAYTAKGMKIFCGENGMTELINTIDDAVIIIALSGISGLLPTISAITSDNKNNYILSANKESIVSAGGIINKLLKDNNKQIIPLDSEHNAIWNLLKSKEQKDVKNIYLTASGGPLLNKEINNTIEAKDVLKHPIWDMGSYITVNSANMLNKGFEVIEAHYLFGYSYDRIKVLVHPQSIVHGIVEMKNGNYHMLASPSNMTYPILQALFHPGTPNNKLPKLDLVNKNLEFYKPDYNKFPLLKLAYEVGKCGGILPLALNSANEICVDAFLNGKIGFVDITDVIHKVIEHFEKKNEEISDYYHIMEYNDLVKEHTKEEIRKIG